MKVSIYILGILERKGPLHGYAIKQLISQDAAHFARIKLPTIYYHLEKMYKEGFVQVSQEDNGKLPDRNIYSISETGKERLKQLLQKSLKTKYEPEFLIDAVFYFGHIMRSDLLIESLGQRLKSVNTDLECIDAKENEICERLPEFALPFAKAILSHHQHHYQAEAKWLEETIQSMKEIQKN